MTHLFPFFSCQSPAKMKYSKPKQTVQIWSLAQRWIRVNSQNITNSNESIKCFNMRKIAFLFTKNSLHQNETTQIIKLPKLCNNEIFDVMFKFQMTSLRMRKLRLVCTSRSTMKRFPRKTRNRKAWQQLPVWVHVTKRFSTRSRRYVFHK